MVFDCEKEKFYKCPDLIKLNSVHHIKNTLRMIRSYKGLNGRYSIPELTYQFLKYFHVTIIFPHWVLNYRERNLTLRRINFAGTMK